MAYVRHSYDYMVRVPHIHITGMFVINMVCHERYTILLASLLCVQLFPDSKVIGANMGPTWVRQDPGGPRVGPVTFAIWIRLDSKQKGTMQLLIL